MKAMASFDSLAGNLMILRPIRLSDAADMYTWASDPEVSKHLPWEPHHSEEETRQYIRECLNAYRDGDWLPLAIENRRTGKVEGNMALYPVKPRHAVAELAFVLAKGLWGTGIIDEAARLLIQWAFEFLIYTRVQAVASIHNEHSIATLERLGFNFEGVLRSYMMVHGVPTDTRMYALLRSDWKPISENAS